MDLAPLEPDLYEKLREDTCRRGIPISILVDSASGEVSDGRQRKQIAAELKIKAIPTIYVGRLTEGEGADLRLESTGDIPHYDARRGANGKRYPAAKPSVYSASSGVMMDTSALRPAVDRN